MMKRFFAYILAALLLPALSACAKVSYRDDLSSQEIADRITDALQAEGEYVNAAPDALDDYFQIPATVRDHTVLFHANRNNLDEFGIFHVSDAEKKEMQALLVGYLSESLTANRAWYDSYIPQETPKLRDAEARIFGNYVVYAILSPSDRAHFFDIIQTILEK